MKLISINIEGEKHLERVIPFVRKERPEVLCLQEVYEAHLSQFTSLGYTYSFLPSTIKLMSGSYDKIGIALCTLGEMENVQSFYYGGSTPELTNFDQEAKVSTVMNGMLSADYSDGKNHFTVATTHFTWTPDGEVASPEQIRDMQAFLSHVQEMQPHIMCGDFNIPRHYNPLFEQLVEHYTDSIPDSYHSSLDQKLHRLGAVPEKEKLFTSFVVDYLFTQPPYTAEEVTLTFGISDHAAVTVTIQRL